MFIVAIFDSKLRLLGSNGKRKKVKSGVASASEFNSLTYIRAAPRNVSARSPSISHSALKTFQ